jgi:hypothetical protein
MVIVEAVLQSIQQIAALIADGDSQATLSLIQLDLGRLGSRYSHYTSQLINTYGQAL